MLYWVSACIWGDYEVGTLLVVIYLAFISLGLPDSLLGAAWPVMRVDLAAPLSAAGAVSMIVSFGTIVSSLMSSRVIRRFGTGKVTLVSVLMTAFALLGYSFARSLWWLCLLAVPLGLGAGSVDAALNNFVAMHYRAQHMSWLHCFWGIGATAGPIILSACMLRTGWASGYRVISVLQFALCAVLAFSIPLWKRGEQPETAQGEEDVHFVSNREALRLPGMPFALLSFLCYCGVEVTAGLWMPSYLVEMRALDTATAAAWGSCFYGGITIGRALSGFLSMRLEARRMIRIGCAGMLGGALILILPLPALFSLFGLLLLGVGCAPIYPSLIHETPRHFGKRASQAAMGLQMAVAYVGSTFVPPLVGAIAGKATLAVVPAALLLLTLALLGFSEAIERKIR